MQDEIRLMGCVEFGNQINYRVVCNRHIGRMNDQFNIVGKCGWEA
jgi:hypothetical protein